MKLSSGAKRELLILFFVRAIFLTASERTLTGTIPRDRSNKVYRINNQLDRRIDSLMQRIDATIDATIDTDNSEWLRKKTSGILSSVLTKIAKFEVQLETFALYLGFINFCERKKPLNNAFKEYSDTDLYFDKIDLLKLANVNDDVEAEMMNLAYKTISELKG